MKDISVFLLSAGLGTRLKPFTEVLPKCLMPIQGIPLLQIWLDNLISLGIESILVNLHYKADDVIAFLNRPKYKGKVDTTFEEKLLGTAGSLRANKSKFTGKTTLLIHADNLCLCNLNDFINYHINERSSNNLMTMMTFETDHPRSCGIVSKDDRGVVTQFFEKVENPPGNEASAAIYLFESELLEWICQKEVDDFSNEVIPNFLGRISTWKNKQVMFDIGTPKNLMDVQKIDVDIEKDNDEWFQNYQSHEIHKMIQEFKESQMSFSKLNT